MIGRRGEGKAMRGSRWQVRNGRVVKARRGSLRPPSRRTGEAVLPAGMQVPKEGWACLWKVEGVAVIVDGRPVTLYRAVDRAGRALGYELVAGPSPLDDRARPDPPC